MAGPGVHRRWQRGQTNHQRRNGPAHAGHQRQPGVRRRVPPGDQLAVVAREGGEHVADVEGTAADEAVLDEVLVTLGPLLAEEAC